MMRPDERLEWLAARKKGIGSSDVGAVLGLNPFKTPLDVYLDKTSDKIQEYDSPRFIPGRFLEDGVSEWFANETGWKIVNENSKIYRHPERDYCFATPDRVIIPEWSDTGVLEVKTSRGSTKRWKEGRVPAYIYAQHQWEMYCSGSSWGAIAWISRGFDFGYCTYSRDDNYLERVVDAVEKFWLSHVQARLPPPPQTVADHNYLHKIVDPDEICEVRHPVLLKIQHMKDLQKRKKEVEAEIRRVADNIKLLFGASESMVCGGRLVATYKRSRNGSRRLKLT